MSNLRKTCFLFVCCLALAVCQYCFVQGLDDESVGRAKGRGVNSGPVAYAGNNVMESAIQEGSNAAGHQAVKLAQLQREILELTRRCYELEAELQYRNLYLEIVESGNDAIVWPVMQNESELKKCRREEKERLHESCVLLADAISNCDFSSLTDEEYGRLLEYCEIGKRLDAILWDDSVPNEEKIELLTQAGNMKDECKKMIERQKEADDVFMANSVYNCVHESLGDELPLCIDFELDGRLQHVFISGNLYW